MDTLGSNDSKSNDWIKNLTNGSEKETNIKENIVKYI